MTYRQVRQLNQKRAQQDTWTVALIALLLVSLLAIKFAVNRAFQHDLATYKQTQCEHISSNGQNWYECPFNN